MSIQILGYSVIILGVLNIIRMTVYMLGSDAYTMSRTLRVVRNKAKRAYRPTVSIVVPVHNEGMIIRRTMNSLAEIEYPAHKLEIIIVDDGSTDNTAQNVRNYIRTYKRRTGDVSRFRLVRQDNGGKADALNNAISNYAKHSLVMCLDGDSTIAPDGITKAVAYFRDRRTMALASNVNIMENGTILGLVQRFEYLISYQMKKAQTTYNFEYIIGGIGSMFRRSMLNRVALYDTNTMTEDIDLTMKIIARGNRKNRVVYGSDVLTYTEPVLSMKALISQRFRWKYGRMQTFLKNTRLFFNRKHIYSKQLTWFILPLALVQECMFLIEPLFITFILFASIYYGNPGILLVSCLIITVYIVFNILSSEHLPRREKIRLSFIAPTMYILMYIIAIVEYAALLKSLRRLHTLPQSIRTERTTWLSPQRSITEGGA